MRLYFSHPKTPGLCLDNIQEHTSSYTLFSNMDLLFMSFGIAGTLPRIAKVTTTAHQCIDARSQCLKDDHVLPTRT